MTERASSRTVRDADAGERAAVTGSERVYEAIMDLIRDGAIAPGDSLRESSLANELGVSRTPVRESLRRLAAEGIVEFLPNRGSTLVAYDRDDVAELFTLRALLEPEAAAGAAVHRADTDLSLLNELLTEMDAAVASRDRRAMAQLNAEFHGAIVAMSGSRVLPELINLVTRKPIVQRTYNRYSDAELERSQRHHRELVEAIGEGNSSWAHSVMRVHIEAARSLYLGDEWQRGSSDGPTSAL
ncbi:MULTISPECIES: GntR family transcriptional regulator [unclassified Microbacterium]|uniref:GntR family transcriptional regulator n=1 Tax=unclassified Microbacterium TaxID=2609290 RepID=UPI000C2C5640|nr:MULTISPECIES: GntR family transcriptional regulator [unclassified Microbacterium]